MTPWPPRPRHPDIVRAETRKLPRTLAVNRENEVFGRRDHRRSVEGEKLALFDGFSSSIGLDSVGISRHQGGRLSRVRGRSFLAGGNLSQKAGSPRNRDHAVDKIGARTCAHARRSNQAGTGFEDPDLGTWESGSRGPRSPGSRASIVGLARKMRAFTRLTPRGVHREILPFRIDVCEVGELVSARRFAFRGREKIWRLVPSPPRRRKSTGAMIAAMPDTKSGSAGVLTIACPLEVRPPSAQAARFEGL